MNSGQCYFLPDSAVSRQVARQAWGQTSPELRHRNGVHGQGHRCVVIRLQTSEPTDETNRDQQHRMGLKRAWDHGQNGWMEPTGEVDQGFLVPSVA